MIRIDETLVTLRPYRSDELDVLTSLVANLPEGAAGYAGPRDRASLRDKIRRSGTWTDIATIDFGVESQERLVGEVQVRQPRHGLPPGVFEVGLVVFRTSDRAHGLGSAMLAAVTRYLFEREGAIRVQLSTDVDNAAMRACALHQGFAYEGTLRAFMPTAEGPRDHVMFAMTKADHEDGNARWT